MEGEGYKCRCVGMRRAPGDIPSPDSPQVMVLPTVDIPEATIHARDKLVVAIFGVVIKGDGT